MISRVDGALDAFAPRANLETSVGALPLESTERVRPVNRLEEARRLLDMSIRFRENGWPVKAKRFAARALAIFGRESRAYDLDVVRVLLCLAGAREDLADYARAGADYRRARDILDLIEDPRGRPYTGPYLRPCIRDVRWLRIQTLRGLANVLRSLGRGRRAETLLKEALAIAEQTFGCTHGDVANVLNDLGVHYRCAGAYEKASQLHHRALAIAEKARDTEHPPTAVVLHQLGVLEQARGRFTAGEGFARRAAEIRQRTYGPDHPQVAAELATIAALLEGQGKHNEAASFYRRAFVLIERWFGPDHPEAALMANRLARITLGHKRRRKAQHRVLGAAGSSLTADTDRRTPVGRRWCQIERRAVRGR
jgi:tetratricopeptide (TPR) repeat protein